MIPPSGVSFRGEVLAVKARIRLLRSFDQISHQYQGFTLVIASADQQPGFSVLRLGLLPTPNISSVSETWYARLAC